LLFHYSILSRNRVSCKPGAIQNEGSGKFPNGGWERIDSIKLGKWKPWHPRPVLIPADSFLEKDHDEQSHWITLESGIFVQALLAERNNERRVYIVTEETPSQYHWIHDRWLRLVKLSDQNKTAMSHDAFSRAHYDALFYEGLFSRNPEPNSEKFEA
jgi:hypothetical protein